MQIENRRKLESMLEDYFKKHELKIIPKIPEHLRLLCRQNAVGNSKKEISFENDSKVKKLTM